MYYSEMKSRQHCTM